jgi:DNA-binding CsgD family transcriptional regulator
MSENNTNRVEYHIFDNLPLLTDFPSRKHWEAAVWQIILERLLALPQEDAALILQTLFSSPERTDAIYRALAISRIRTGISLREIGRELWLTRQTVSAIKKSLRDGEYKSSATRGHKPK